MLRGLAEMAGMGAGMSVGGWHTARGLALGLGGKCGGGQDTCLPNHASAGPMAGCRAVCTLAIDWSRLWVLVVPWTAAETAMRKVTGSRTAKSRSVAWGGGGWIMVGLAARSVPFANGR